MAYFVRYEGKKGLSRFSYEIVTEQKILFSSNLQKIFSKFTKDLYTLDQ